MKRRSVVKGLLGASGLGLIASAGGYNYIKSPTGFTREELGQYELLLAELVDVIIPPSETPGAKEAQVHRYILSYMNNCATDKEYRNFYYGLKEIETFTVNNVGISFQNCSQVQKNALLKEVLEGEVSNATLRKIKTKLRGNSFAHLLKKLTVDGYCQSRPGATQHLAYQPIPGKYEAITQLKPNQPCWATK
jgi:hypothetical protein